MPKSRMLKLVRDFLGLSKYESEATKFMREFMAQHPEEIDSQRKGRSIWWDKDAKERTAPPETKTAPKSGGAEYTFRA